MDKQPNLGNSPVIAHRRRKWLNALRGNKYKQCTGVLRLNERHFCALGVGCHIYNPAKWVKPFAGDYAYAESGVLMSDNIAKAYQLSLWDRSQITLLNDQYRYSFTTIANLLEARWLSGEWC